MRHRSRIVTAAPIALVLLVVGPVTAAHAQAWVSEPGTLDTSLDYNLGISSKVIPDEGADFDDAGTTSHQFTLGAEYAPMQHLAISASLPLVMLKYTGNKTLYPHPAGGRYDDGNYHTTLTDLRAGARYQVLEEPVAIAPHLAFSIPVADYETIGNTVAGRGLKQAHIGVSVGKLLTDALYTQIAYEFSLVDRYNKTFETFEYSQNRSDASFVLGYALPALRLDFHVDANLRLAHGGINFSEFPALDPTYVVAYHDAILKEDILLVGAGVSYQVTNSLAVSLSGRAFAWGRNTQNANVFALGVAWTPISP